MDIASCAKALQGLSHRDGRDAVLLRLWKAAEDRLLEPEDQGAAAEKGGLAEAGGTRGRPASAAGVRAALSAPMRPGWGQELRTALRGSVGASRAGAQAVPALLYALQTAHPGTASHGAAVRAGKEAARRRGPGRQRLDCTAQAARLASLACVLSAEAARTGAGRASAFAGGVWCAGRLGVSRATLEEMMTAVASPAQAVSLVHSLTRADAAGVFQLSNVFWACAKAGVAAPPALVSAACSAIAAPPGGRLSAHPHEVATLAWGLVQQPSFWGSRSGGDASWQWFVDRCERHVSADRSRRWAPTPSLARDEREAAALRRRRDAGGRKGSAAASDAEILAEAAVRAGDDEAAALQRSTDGSAERSRRSAARGRARDLALAIEEAGAATRRRALAPDARRGFVAALSSAMLAPGALRDLTLGQLVNAVWTTSTLRNFDEAADVGEALLVRCREVFADGEAEPWSVSHIALTASLLGPVPGMHPFLSDVVDRLAPPVAPGMAITPWARAAAAQAEAPAATGPGNAVVDAARGSRGRGDPDAAPHAGAPSSTTHSLSPELSPGLASLDPAVRIGTLVDALAALTNAGYRSERLAVATASELVSSWRSIDLRRLPSALNAVIENLGAARSRGLLAQAEPGAAAFAAGVTATVLRPGQLRAAAASAGVGREAAAAAAAALPRPSSRLAVPPVPSAPLEGAVLLAEAFADARLSPPSVMGPILAALRAATLPGARRPVGADQITRCFEALASAGVDSALIAADDAQEEPPQRRPRSGGRAAGAHGRRDDGADVVGVTAFAAVPTRAAAMAALADAADLLRAKQRSSLVSALLRRERTRAFQRSGQAEDRDEHDDRAGDVVPSPAPDTEAVRLAAPWLSAASPSSGGASAPVFLDDTSLLMAASSASALACLEETVVAGPGGACGRVAAAPAAMRLARFAVANAHPSATVNEDGRGVSLPRIKMAALAAARHDDAAYGPAEDAGRAGGADPALTSGPLGDGEGRAALATARALLRGDWEALGLVEPAGGSPGRGKRGGGGDRHSKPDGRDWASLPRLRAALAARWAETDAFAPWRSPVRPATVAPPPMHPARVAAGLPGASDRCGVPAPCVAPLLEVLATSTVFAARGKPFSNPDARDVIALARGLEAEAAFAREHGAGEGGAVGDDAMEELCRQWVSGEAVPGAAAALAAQRPDMTTSPVVWGDVAASLSDPDPSARTLGGWPVKRVMAVAALVRLGGATRLSLMDAAAVWSREARGVPGLAPGAAGVGPGAAPPKPVPARRGWELERTSFWAAPSPGVRVPASFLLRHAATGRRVRVVVDVLAAEEEVASWPAGTRQGGGATVPGVPPALSALLVPRSRLAPYAAAVHDVLEAAVEETSPRPRISTGPQHAVAEAEIGDDDEPTPDAVALCWLRETEWNRIRAAAEPPNAVLTDLDGSAMESLFEPEDGTASGSVREAQDPGAIAGLGWDGSRMTAAVPGSAMRGRAVVGRIGPVTTLGRSRLADVLAAVVDSALAGLEVDLGLGGRRDERS